MKGCGAIHPTGHGEAQVCGEEDYGGIWYCSNCTTEEIRRLETTIDKLTYAERLSHEAIGTAIQEVERLQGTLKHVYDNLRWNDDREEWYLDRKFTISSLEMATQEKK